MNSYQSVNYFPRLSIAMEYENGDDNLMIFHSLSSKSSEKYKKELDKL